MTDVYSLVYRPVASGKIVGEVFEDMEVLRVVAATSISMMKDGHYMVFKGNFKEAVI